MRTRSSTSAEFSPAETVYAGPQSPLDRVLALPRLPSPPALALRIFRKAGQDECTVGEISDLLALDPGLSAKLLKTLNSAAYGRSHPVTSVRQAVALLGSRPLRSLILGLALPVMQSGVHADAGLCRFWMRSVSCAVMARDLAIRCHWPAPDDELAVGLLCDLGMLLLRQAFGEAYDPVWSDANGLGGTQQCAWEEQNLGVDHAAVCAALLDRWHLPMEFIEPIRHHHQPEQLPPSAKHLVDRAYLLQFTSRLTQLEEGSRPTSGLAVIIQTAQEKFGMSRGDLETFLASVRPRIEEFTRILGVEIGQCPDFEELLATGCEEMVRLSLETAASAPVPSVIPGGANDQAGLSSASFSSLREWLDEPERVAAGARLLQYELTRYIGRGCMGIVFQAIDTGLARQVAIKILAPELLVSRNARQRFAREARCAAALRHEHVVAIHAIHEVDGIPFLVMEYVNGTSLGELLRGGLRFQATQIARIGRQAALALDAAHRIRLIHRDIKPDNILLDRENLWVRVADFGLARTLDEDSQLSQPGMLVGTPCFMSPEQMDGKPLTPASDLFSLGSMLYMVCTGQYPFKGETLSGVQRAILSGTPTPIRQLNLAIPPDLVAVIDALLEKDPARRPTSALQVAEALSKFCD